MASIVSFVFSVLYMAVNGLMIVLLRRYLVTIFTRDVDVLQLASQVIVVNAIFQVFDAAQTCLAGVLRGTGKQTVGAVFNFIAFYVLGLPLGLVLAFPAGMKLYGIWTGIAVALFIVTCVALAYVLLRIDFEKQVQLALERVARSDIHRSEVLEGGELELEEYGTSKGEEE